MPKVNEEQCVVLECELPRSGCEYCERHHMRLCGQLHHRIRKGDDEQNLGVPSGQPLKDKLSDAEPSPRPWKQSCFLITARNGDWVAHTGMGNLPPSRSHESEANAELIVRAVNAHDALIAALRPLADFQYENVTKYTHDEDSRVQIHVSVPVEEIEAARAALAKVNAPKQEK